MASWAAARSGAETIIARARRSAKEAAKLRADAKEFVREQRWEEAMTAVDKAIDMCPDSHGSHKSYRLRSFIWSCLDDFQRSIADAERVIELAPHLADGHYHKGCALYHLKDYAGAAASFQEALKLSPTDKILLHAFQEALALLHHTRALPDFARSLAEDGGKEEAAAAPSSAGPSASLAPAPEGSLPSSDNVSPGSLLSLRRG